MKKPLPVNQKQNKNRVRDTPIEPEQENTSFKPKDILKRLFIRAATKTNVNKISHYDTNFLTHKPSTYQIIR